MRIATRTYYMTDKQAQTIEKLDLRPEDLATLHKLPGDEELLDTVVKLTELSEGAATEWTINPDGSYKSRTLEGDYFGVGWEELEFNPDGSDA